MNTYLLPVAICAVMFAIYIYNRYSTSELSTTEDRRSRFHCLRITQSTKTSPKTKPLPWSSRSVRPNENTSSDTILYVWPTKANVFRLGNRLFNYASTFGIAWRNGRIPIIPDTIWPYDSYDLGKFFHIRIPVDKGNRIIKVIFYFLHFRF